MVRWAAREAHIAKAVPPRIFSHDPPLLTTHPQPRAAPQRRPRQGRRRGAGGGGPVAQALAESNALVLIISIITHVIAPHPYHPTTTRAPQAAPQPSQTSRATSSPAKRTPACRQGAQGHNQHSLSACFISASQPCRAREPLPPALAQARWPPSLSFVHWAACFSAGTLVRKG